MASKGAAHKWEFLPRFRSRAYGWSGSALACKRIKEALSEINAVGKRDLPLAAEGGVRLLERIYPAFQQIDTSSGALGSAVNRAIETVADLLRRAEVDEAVRAKWLERLWIAKEEDDMPYLDDLPERWGEICGSPETASKWADRLIGIVRGIFTAEERTSYFFGTTACLSCLLSAGRYEELVTLVEMAPYKWWHYRQYAARAIAATGRTDEAIDYALNSGGINDNRTAIDRFCEETLISAGRTKEAYSRFGLTAHRATTNLSTFRTVRKRYPEQDPIAILGDLVRLSPGEEGKWFATAKDLKQFGLALELAATSPTDPGTLSRAARDFAVTNPAFALEAAVLSLHWMAQGYGYELTNVDVLNAFRYATAAAELLGTSAPTMERIKKIVNADKCDSFVQKALRPHVPTR